MRDFRELLVWQKGHRLVLDVYRATQHFPIDERFGLTSQLRRAAASVPTNIAEGCGRGSAGQLAWFLQISMGSASEVEYLLMLCHDLGYLEDHTYGRLREQTVEVKRMLAPFINRLRRK